MTTRVIALDFDGVLHDYRCWDISWSDHGDPLELPVQGAQDAVGRFLEAGFDVAVFSTSAKNQLYIDGIRAWLRRHQFASEWAINATITNEKLHCALYVDDRGFRFEGHWEPLFEFLEKNPRPKRWGQKR